VLREFATRIRRNTRGIDLACRLGGEEFVVVMPDCDLATACQVGERLRQCIEAAAFEVGGKVGRLDVTASVGVAALEFDDDAPELMLKRADQALYCAKRDGRNRVVADAA
jgi:two-component system cell cycle response regulator